METDNFEIIKQRSVKGVVALASRTMVLQLIAFVATFLLTVLLSPAEYGVFFLVSALINFFTYFSDVGLAAALIQKKKKLTDDDLNTTFLIQQTLVVILVVLACLSSSLVGRWYGLSRDGVWLFRVLAFSLLLSSLKTIPSIILERKLLFQKLILPQIFENLVFYAVAVILAWRGFGVNSFTYAILARGLIGLVVIYLIVPWWPKFNFNWRVAKRLFSFGLPFQTNSLLALVKDDLLTAFLGKVLPLASIGYIGWAKKWAYFPYRIISDNVIRITFPVFARLQKYPDKIKAAIEKSVLATALLFFPAAAGLFTLVNRFITIIPKYAKWQPAVLSLRIFIITAVISAIGAPLINALNGVGKIKITLRFMVLWTVLTWAFTPILVFKLGYNGVALSLLLVTLSTFWVIKKVCQMFTLRISWDLTKLLFSSSIMVGVLIVLNQVLPANPLALILEIIIGGLVYFGVSVLVSRAKLVNLFNLVKLSLSKNAS